MKTAQMFFEDYVAPSKSANFQCVRGFFLFRCISVVLCKKGKLTWSKKNKQAIQLGYANIITDLFQYIII